MYDIDFLINNGYMDVSFPYPQAFCTAFNLGVILASVLIFFCLAYIIYILVRWFFRLF